MGEKSTATARTPARPAPASKKSGTASTGKQQSILGFFSKSSAAADNNGPASSPLAKASSSAKDLPARPLKETTKSNSMLGSKRPSNVTPVPSSDVVEPLSSQENMDTSTVKKVGDSSQSPFTSAKIVKKQVFDKKVSAGSSPSRKVRRASPLGHSSLVSNPSYLGQEDGQLRRIFR